MSWGLGATGDCSSSFSSPGFHWKIVIAKLEIILYSSNRWNRTKSRRQKSSALNFTFRRFLLGFFISLFLGLLTHFTNPSGYHLHDFFLLSDTNFNIFQFWEDHHEYCSWWKLKPFKFKFSNFFMNVRILFDSFCKTKA